MALFYPHYWQNHFFGVKWLSLLCKYIDTDIDIIKHIKPLFFGGQNLFFGVGTLSCLIPMTVQKAKKITHRRGPCDSAAF